MFKVEEQNEKHLNHKYGVDIDYKGNPDPAISPVDCNLISDINTG